MTATCERWQSWLEPGPPEDPNGAAPRRAPGGDTEREEHLATCADCREQWSAHQALGALAAVPPPALSRDLGPILGKVVAASAPTSMLSPAQRLWMRLYWLAATFTAGVVLAQLGPASTAWVFFWLFAAALALAGLPALLLLRRRLSWGLMDLLVWTLR